jgi:hypothetical protein
MLSQALLKVETPFLKLGKKFIISTVVSEDSKKREGTVCRGKEFLIEINLEDTRQATREIRTKM